MENKNEAIALLNRVALRLEQRGISPASDIEKLRALAHQLESGTSFNINDIAMGLTEEEWQKERERIKEMQDKRTGETKGETE